eukprot:CAMPEP_0178987938 /NCGR_PEP_ID=MMETSP0795-20121207/3545_1 /TAXON_ID=88552 /ORGANISM="Amoebophrya sp., Strain Ameob2" /LENGTH=279 /DNA_ID=CAMNT_0020679181 /DNA_START=111 /DNA_END=951 /DNA_ORIENTATION=+
MVILHVKKGEKKNEFLQEVLTSESVSDVLKKTIELHNLRLKVLRLALSLRELGKHGPLRPEETRGLTEDTNFPLDVNAYGTPTNPDEHGYRTGCPPPGEVGEVLIRTADESEAAVSHLLVTQRKNLSKEVCEECLAQMRGAVMIAYPAFHKLPFFDPVRLELENKEELDGSSELQDVLEVSESVLWFAGKEMVIGKLLSDYLGKNEKTKVVIKLQSKAAGAPVREHVMAKPVFRNDADIDADGWLIVRVLASSPGPTSGLWLWGGNEDIDIRLTGIELC